MKTETERVSIPKILMTLAMAAVMVVMVFPLLWMLTTSFKVEADVFNFPIQWIPPRPTVSNYVTVITGKYDFLLFYFNSIKVTILTVIGQLVVCSMGAYAFAKMDFRFKTPLFSLLLAVMMIPAQVTLVPSFMMMNWMRLYDTHLGIILMGLFNVYGVFLLRQGMMSIPDSICEAARIDGASHPRIFASVILPMSKPTIATLTILRFLWCWNDYQTPLVFLRNRKLFTLQLGMSQFADTAGQIVSQTMAASMLCILPLLVIFFAAQKSVIGGLAAGAVKG
jgi:multiple sugar transport system permease protein